MVYLLNLDNAALNLNKIRQHNYLLHCRFDQVAIDVQQIRSLCQGLPSQDVSFVVPLDALRDVHDILVYRVHKENLQFEEK